MKDLPKMGARESEFVGKREGKNMKDGGSGRYWNHLPPENEKNNEAIQGIMKGIPGDTIQLFKKFCSPYIVELVQYLRCALLVRIGESENVEMPEKGDLRV